MHFPLSFCKNASPYTFSMVHLLHRLYGVDAPTIDYKYQTMVAVSRSRWLVKGVIGGSPSMRFTSTALAKHMSIVENQLARGCFRDNTCEAVATSQSKTKRHHAPDDNLSRLTPVIIRVVAKGRSENALVKWLYVEPGE